MTLQKINIKLNSPPHSFGHQESKVENVKSKIELTTTVFFLLVTKNRLKLNSGFFETWEPELLLLWLLLELRTSKILDVDLFSWMTEWNCDVLPTGAQRFVFTRFFFDNVEILLNRTKLTCVHSFRKRGSKIIGGH